MRIVGFIPSKLASERVPQKNIKELGGIPLVNYAVRTLNRISSIDETIIYASEPSICDYIQDDLKYTFLKRPQYLDTQDANIQDFTKEFIKQDKADIIVLLHITAPFVKVETISKCIDKVAHRDHDSAFAASALTGFCWYHGKPLNYELKGRIPRTQDIEPIVVESGLYVFRRDLFENTGQRTSNDPYVVYIDYFEGHDIDTPEDFNMAEVMFKSGLVNPTK